MHTPVCYLFGAGDPPLRAPVIRPGDLVIAADAGLQTLHALGLRADLVVGDFDSLGETPAGSAETEVIRHPVRKDETDMALAAEIAVSRGYSTLLLYGGTGGRLDHTLANLQLIADLSTRRVRAILAGPDCSVTALTDGTLRFPAGMQGTVSVFAHGGTARGVTLCGLSYPLQDAVLSPFVPLGVSNAFLGEESSITVRDGTLLIFWYGRPLPEDTEGSP